MAELFVGPIMDRIINTCFEYLQDHLMEKRLRENQLTIKAVVSVSSQADIEDPALNKWMWQLRDAIDEADDLLDEFAYAEHEKLLHKNKAEVDLKRLEEVVQKLDRISAEVSNFLYLLKVQDLELLKAREEGSFPKSDLIGRDKDKECIKQWFLRKPDDETDVATNNLYKNISVLCIVGHGGMGKTSLLQHVYQDEVTKDFDPKMWVRVSNHFEVKELIADMLESSEGNRPSSNDVNGLQEKLKSKVMSKKFLLVLDDIWDIEWDIKKWETVLAPLAHGSLGSKILITTRMNSVASMISKVIQKKPEKLSLEGLKEDECLQLLSTHAFANIKNQSDDHEKLKFIAKERVKKLFGCPLAAKVLGGVLNSKMDERFWTSVLDKALGHTEILPILKLSYIFLPKKLQNCFTFCSIFPQDHRFDKDDLVRMWIAVGFIQPSDIQGGEDLEDIGGRYFDNLVEKSFFDFFDKDYFYYYKMHDLLHDVARYISVQECSRFVGDDQKLFTGVRETIQHLSIKTSNVEVLKNLKKFKNLRTLWISYDKTNQDFEDVLTEIFKEVRSIRLLHRENYDNQLIPHTIRYLIHLRYLRLHFDAFTPFPIHLCNLYHLQFIIHDDISNGRCLPHIFPMDMSNFTNLRHTNFNSLKFSGIGKLKSLRDPITFYVKNEIGYRIGELELMNDIRILKICDLENVRDAKEAKLFDKQKLTNLSLNWGLRYKERKRINIADPELDERVLDNLQPHNDLKVLEICFYKGVRSALWMIDTDLIKNLQKIVLHGCSEWQNLPPFGQLLFLKSLSLHFMPKAKRFDNKYNGNNVCCAFQSLEQLQIGGLEAMEDWFDGGDKAEEDGCLFPCLTQLTLFDCPNLQELPYLPPKLKKLRIKNIGWKTLNCCSISKSVLLDELDVSGCPNITYIFLEGEVGELRIKDCPNLIYLGGHEEVETNGNNKPASVESLQYPPSSLSTISSLNRLLLIGISFLKSLPELPPSLRSLYIGNLENLDCLPSCIPNLSSLAELFIDKIPKLRELPDLPHSIHTLRLDNLDNLDCLPSCLHTVSSLKQLVIRGVPQLRELPDLPPSLGQLSLLNMDNLNCMPTLSSITYRRFDLSITGAPKLQKLQDLPPSLWRMCLSKLDNLDCLPSCLPTLLSLEYLTIYEAPKLCELPDLPPSLNSLHLKNLGNLDCLPSSLPNLPSLHYLTIDEVPKLRELPDLPASLRNLNLENLDNLNCLPSCLPTLPSLTNLDIKKVPKLQKLPNLPPSLGFLVLNKLDNLDCLPTLPSLRWLSIEEVPKLQKLPNVDATDPTDPTFHFRRRGGSRKKILNP